MLKKATIMIKKNSLILLWAAIFATWIFYVVNNPNIFTASILSLQEQQFIIDKWRDIAYKTNSWYVDIFMSENMEIPTSIDFTILFDKDKISIEPQNLSGQVVSTIIHQNDNEIMIRASELQNKDNSQSILLLPFTGESENILLSEAVATLIDGKQKNLSIGTLNEISSHSK